MLWRMRVDEFFMRAVPEFILDVRSFVFWVYLYLSDHPRGVMEIFLAYISVVSLSLIDFVGQYTNFGFIFVGLNILAVYWNFVHILVASLSIIGFAK